MSERVRIWGELLFGQRAMMIRMADELKHDHGLTVPQFEALNALSKTKDHLLSASELGNALLYSSGSATNLIKRLEELGLVRREACATDARVVLVSLTEEGLARITAAAAAHRASIEREFGTLIEDEEIPVIRAFTRRLIRQERA